MLKKKRLITAYLIYFLICSVIVQSQSCDSCLDNYCIEDCTSINSDIIVYGKVSDENGNVLENEKITAIWTDASGKKNSYSTQTLSNHSAAKLGNPFLAGYYIFTVDDLAVETGGLLTVKTELRYEEFEILVEPDNPQLAKPIIIKGKKLTSHELSSYYWISILNKIRIFLLALIILSIIFPIFYYFITRKKKIEGYDSYILFLSSKVENCIKEKVLTSSQHDPVSLAHQKMIESRVNSIVVVDQEMPVGIITEDNFLKKVYNNKNSSQLKVSDVMTSPVITCLGSITLASAIKLMIDKKIRKLPVVKNSKLIGIITITDILKLLNKHPGDEGYGKIPLVEDIFRKDIVATTKSSKISDVINTMISKNSSYIIIYDKTSGMDRPLGIITTRDLLYEYYKNPDSLKTLSAMHLMKSPIRSIKSNMDIFDANTHMLYENFRRMFITVNTDLKGTLTQITLLKAIYNFLRNKCKK